MYGKRGFDMLRNEWGLTFVSLELELNEYILGLKMN